ncbi:HdeD family acid-resistance protein [Raineyella fluvialis]|nr:DUF308 domain-containing protein [Raineyella fluvialis]
MAMDIVAVPSATRKPTGWDLLVGIAPVLAGLVLLGEAALATTMSVWLIGWFALVSGTVVLLATLSPSRSAGSWQSVLGGAALIVAGLVILLRFPVLGIVDLTLVGAAMLLGSGLTRLVFGWALPVGRWWLVVGGLVPMLAGLFVLLHLGLASTQLLGFLLGGQALLEGIAVISTGRPRPEPAA